jgi:hypothetical protein
MKNTKDGSPASTDDAAAASNASSSNRAGTTIREVRVWTAEEKPKQDTKRLQPLAAYCHEVANEHLPGDAFPREMTGWELHRALSPLFAPWPSLVVVVETGEPPRYAVITGIKRFVDLALEPSCVDAFKGLCRVIDVMDAGDKASVAEAAKAVREFNVDALQGHIELAFAESGLGASLKGLPANWAEF